LNGLFTIKKAGVYLQEWKNNWDNEWRKVRFRIRLVVTFLLFVFSIILFSRFLDWVEGRAGVILADPVLQLFQPLDLTWLTFLTIYLSLIAGLIHLSREPRQLLVTLQAYILLLLARALSMYLMPLDPPATLIPLVDPFVESVSSGVLTRDLFFSGHTSTLFLLFLGSTQRKIKIVFLTATIAVGICVLLQHVHYTIDVIVAPFYSYICYRISVVIHQKLYTVQEKEPY